MRIPVIGILFLIITIGYLVVILSNKRFRKAKNPIQEDPFEILIGTKEHNLEFCIQTLFLGVGVCIFSLIIFSLNNYVQLYVFLLSISPCTWLIGALFIFNGQQRKLIINNEAIIEILPLRGPQKTIQWKNLEKVTKKQNRLSLTGDGTSISIMCNYVDHPKIVKDFIETKVKNLDYEIIDMGK
ncbi:hypothetical protein LJC64_05345 [Ruminococcaceae bacterium OttesenSCG-928-A11]|nr:hypothetical protein [Ruminococcaceae bacterium OttesenSCG-928-A11]